MICDVMFEIHGGLLSFFTHFLPTKKGKTKVKKNLENNTK